MKMMPETSSREIDTPKMGSSHNSNNLKDEINHDGEDLAHTIKKSLTGNIALDEKSFDTKEGESVLYHPKKKKRRQRVLQSHSHNESNLFGMNIFVKPLKGETIALVVNSLDTIGYLKMKLHEETGILPCQQRIVYDRRQLEDTRTLLDYGVHNGDVLHLVLRVRGGGPIVSVLKKRFTCQEEFSDTVGSLKEKIQEHEDIPSAQQILSYPGKQLEDGHSSSGFGIQSEATHGIGIGDDMRITLTEILSAIGNFDNAYLIGRGGSAKVYKGELRGKVVAIKRLNPERDEIEPNETKNFGVEVAALGACDHPNIVKMIGYYMDEKERIIVSEYVARGSLYSLLHARSPDDPILDWNTRLRIALDIASGMTYLHDNLHIIHRDLKAQNILLDEHLRAKVADLGVVKSRAYDDGEVYTELIGTRGYMCSEYVTTGSVGTYSDVYAFGVILLELISGKKAFNPTGRFLLADWARRIMQNGSQLELFEPHLVGEIDESVLKNVAALAIKCVALRKEDRPSMKRIHYALHWMKEMQNAEIQ